MWTDQSKVEFFWRTWVPLHLALILCRKGMIGVSADIQLNQAEAKPELTY